MEPLHEQNPVSGLGKAEKYEYLLVSLRGLLTDESDLTANLANTAALLKSTFDWWWVGFYLVKGTELVLGPFQGPVACTRIGKGKGVCGSSWEKAETLLVPDVHAFPGHIACSAASNSEIVVPIIRNGEVLAVLDADSVLYARFDEMDASHLQQVASILSDCF